MRGFDIREWKALDWAGFASLIALTLIPTINAGMKDYPEFAARMPAFISWPYLPVPLLLFLFGVIAIRSLERKTPQPPQQTQNADEAKSLLPPRAFPKQRFHAPTDFFVLPRSVTVELLGQPPEVQAQFYVVSFVPRPIKLIDVELSVRVNSLPRLDDVTCRQKDLLIDPKEYEVIVCRRQLTNAESGYQWKAGRASNADFQLTAKATDGEKTFTYGPVADMVIEGWVNASADDKNTPPPEPVSKHPLPLLEVESEFVALRDAAAHIYDELKKGGQHFWTVVADNQAQGDPEAILDKMANLIVGKIPVYGRQLPRQTIERLNVNEQSQTVFEGGGKTMRFLLFNMPPCVDLRVKERDVEDLVSSLKGGLTADTPI